MRYIQIPLTITYNDLAQKCSLSPSSYKALSFKNQNVKKIRELLLEKPQKGQEVGSFLYINKSKFYFIRTKALQSSYFLPVLNDVECAIPILPMAFKDFKLRKGDILISKDANIGESVYLDDDLPNFMISGGIVRLRFSEDIMHYVFAFMKNEFFKSQIDFLVRSRGATIRHAKTLWLDALIPIPNQSNKDEVIEYVSLLTKAVIRKESEIKKKYEKIINLIEKELKQNQKPNKFTYNMPLLRDLEESIRLDAEMFCKDYKEKQFIIENYTYGARNIFDFGFDFKRGQNLQVSQIRRSIYTEEYKSNFYKLIRPLNLSDYGTVEKYEYLGNPRKLQTLNRGEILFSAEGTIGKICVFIDVDDKTITNIHGITIFRKNNEDDIESIFLGLFLGYLRLIGILDYISVGGQGGSLAQKYWEYIKIPNFPRPKKEELARYYYNSINYKEDKLNLTEFENEDTRITVEAGIWQLDKQIRVIKQKLDEILYEITMDKEVDISFDFLKDNNKAIK
ncbi:MAG: hypothetical protein QXZ12_08765 [Thermoplasmata archaeon]